LFSASQPLHFKYSTALKVFGQIPHRLKTVVSFARYPNENHRLGRLSVLVTLYFDKIFNPRSVAIVGASDEEGTVGYALIKNFTELGFAGKVYPVNIRKTEILGLGTKMVDHVIDICKDMGVETI